MVNTSLYSIQYVIEGCINNAAMYTMSYIISGTFRCGCFEGVLPSCHTT